MIIEHPIRLMIADDHQLFADGVAEILQLVEGIVVVGQTADGQQTIDLIHSLHPDVLLLDINLPTLNGIEVAAKLQRDAPHIQIVALTMYDEPRFVDKMRAAGAKGYLLKNCSKTELIEAIRTVATGQFYIDKRLTTKALAPEKPADDFTKQFSLTKREVEIIRLVKSGLNSQQIADQLTMSLLTVRTHRKNIHYKLNVSNTAELIHFANEHHI